MNNAGVKQIDCNGLLSRECTVFSAMELGSGRPVNLRENGHKTLVYEDT